MHLVAGLGNPGPKYAGNRHNVGFMVVDELARRWGAPSFRSKCKGELTKVAVGGQDVVLLKPMTYMNRSGESVQAAMQFFKVPVGHVACIHDELDLELGVVRLKVGGGTAGHNGLRSVIQHCGSPDFLRCRVGIGRPERGQPGAARTRPRLSKQMTRITLVILPHMTSPTKRLLQLRRSSVPSKSFNRLIQRY